MFCRHCLFNVYTAALAEVSIINKLYVLHCNLKQDLLRQGMHDAVDGCLGQTMLFEQKQLTIKSHKKLGIILAKTKGL